MKPTSGRIFVNKPEANRTISKYDVVDSNNAKYQVIEVADDVTRCNVGDFVLFKDYRTYSFDGKEIFIVEEDDIVAVKIYSEIKK